jgi:hypothetical protein
MLSGQKGAMDESRPRILRKLNDGRRAFRTRSEGISKYSIQSQTQDRNCPPQEFGEVDFGFSPDALNKMDWHFSDSMPTSAAGSNCLNEPSISFVELILG